MNSLWENWATLRKHSAHPLLWSVLLWMVQTVLQGDQDSGMFSLSSRDGVTGAATEWHQDVEVSSQRWDILGSGVTPHCDEDDDGDLGVSVSVGWNSNRCTLFIGCEEDAWYRVVSHKWAVFGERSHSKTCKYNYGIEKQLKLSATSTSATSIVINLSKVRLIHNIKVYNYNDSSRKWLPDNTRQVVALYYITKMW